MLAQRQPERQFVQKEREIVVWTACNAVSCTFRKLFRFAERKHWNLGTGIRCVHGFDGTPCTPIQRVSGANGVQGSSYSRDARVNIVCDYDAYNF